MKIRQATIEDADQIFSLFRGTVTFVNSADYTPEEINIWANVFGNPGDWNKHILTQYFLVAEINGQITGISSIEDNGYLDLMYVHKDYQHQGIAKALLTEIEKRAKKLSLKKIFCHVSKTAGPFFSKKGYVKTGDHFITVQGIEFVNSLMEKTI